MANKEKHIPIGILAPWLVLTIYLILRKGSIPFTFSENPWVIVAILVSVVSFVGERLPDWLEPPDNPNHRGLIHWIGFFALLYIIIFVLGTAPMLPLISLSYDQLFGLLVISFLSGYASHFVFDYILRE